LKLKENERRGTKGREAAQAGKCFVETEGFTMEGFFFFFFSRELREKSTYFFNSLIVEL
jgi:hypothetical protein